MKRALVVACLLATAPLQAVESKLPAASVYKTPDNWLQPVAPFQIADHTWYIGTEGLTALLIKTEQGAILIDGGMPQAADMLLAHMRQLDVTPADLKLILHSHAHADHVGPLAAVKRATGARLVTNAESAALLARGGTDDIHNGDSSTYAPVQTDRLLLDGEVVELGNVRLTAHFTPGHTPGSLSWTWTDSRGGKPVQIAYADSITAPNYQLIGNERYPHIESDYRVTFRTLAGLACSVLITPHPEASGWATTNPANPHEKPMSCRTYAENGAKRLDEALTAQRKEAGSRWPR